MGFFDEIFDGFERRGQGRHRGHGHHDHDDDHDDHRYPSGGPNDTAPVYRAASAPCSRCNAVFPALPGARFCPGCGNPIAADPTCRSCGSRLVAGAAFCPGCGTKA